MVTVLYNLACSRAAQKRLDDALSLLEEAFQMRPDYKAGATSDEDLAALYDNPRFQAAIKG
jgi:hypothetical protein